MRIDCALEGFEGCYLEITDRWTRAELRRFWDAKGEDEDGALIREKTVAVRLVAADGMVIDEPEELINEVIDGLPYELYLWLPQAFGTAVARLMELSKKNVRASFATTAANGSASPTNNGTPGS